MFNFLKKNEKPQSKLASFSDRNSELNEAELKKVVGGDGGTNTTGTGTTPDPSDGKRKNGAIMTADF